VGEPYKDLHIGFTGTRNGMTREQCNSLVDLLESLVKGRFHWVAHHGDCLGADKQFHEIAKHIGASIIVHPPEDKRLRAYCEGDHVEDPKPYSRRNQDIVNDSDLVIAAPYTATNPGHGGTWQTIRFAQDADKLHRIIIPNGAVLEP
jgi:hypothetical protein